ncbi:MAG: transporter substrate-binding domain-containing protein [Clostridia bacterium]|nr:transporter substrate-binding domain-containing protein [Clostridia bacterium]
MRREMVFRLAAAFFLCFLVLITLVPKQILAETAGEIDLSKAGLRIGVANGTIQETIVRQLYPDAELFYFEKVDGCAALSQGKIDCYLYDRNQLEITVAKGQNGVRLLDQQVGEAVDIALGISEVSTIPELPKKVNEFIDLIHADGTLDDMFDRWVVRGDTVMPEIGRPQSPQFHLKVATTGIVEPYSYYHGVDLTGFDIELMNRFAEWLNADVTFEIYDYGSIVAAAHTGKVDLISANLQVTPERAEALLFSKTLYQEQTAIAVRASSASVAANAPVTVHWQDYNGKRLGVLVGPLMEDTAAACFPDSEYLILNSNPDCVAALLTGKIDAFLGDEPVMKSLHAEQPEIDYIHDNITLNNYSFAFRKNDPESAALCEELNEFLARCWADGTMQELDDIWFGIDESRKVVDMSSLTGEKGTIRVVTTSTDMPFSYIKDGKNVGYDIDLVVRFCRDRGYALELGDVDFAGRIPAIQSGKYDFTTDMNVTPEREEQVLFSDPTSHGGIVLAVRASDLAAPVSAAEGNAGAGADVRKGSTAGQGGTLLSLQDSFNKTFIRERRWMLFLHGISTTMLITLLSALSGTALGFVIFMLCRNGNRAANGVTNFCVWLVQGMPMVVLLMVLYYIIFGRVDVSGIAVAVIGFTLTFGASVFGLIKMGVNTIDQGQYEAAYALGYSNRRTFFRIILPQAIPLVLPAYQGELVALIKATAIVGYIAVQDLTKMGDIVRSRTYEAFFPLIAVTVIYFVLEGIMNALVGWIRGRIDPKKRSKAHILRGIRTDV